MTYRIRLGNRISMANRGRIVMIAIPLKIKGYQGSTLWPIK